MVTSKDDGVEAGFAPQLHEVNHVSEAQGGVAGEHHARLTELTAEVSVNAGVVLQLVGLDQLKRQRGESSGRSRHHRFPARHSPAQDIVKNTRGWSGHCFSGCQNMDSLFGDIGPKIFQVILHAKAV